MAVYGGGKVPGRDESLPYGLTVKGIWRQVAGRACPAPTTAANKKIPVHTCLSPTALHKFYITFTLPWWCALCAYIIIESGIVKTKQRMDV